MITCDIVTETDQIVLLCFLAGQCYCVALLKLLNSHKQEKQQPMCPLKENGLIGGEVWLYISLPEL